MRWSQMWLAAGLWAWQLQSALVIPPWLVVWESFGTSSWQNSVDEPLLPTEKLCASEGLQSDGHGWSIVWEWRWSALIHYRCRKREEKAAFEEKMTNFVNQVTVLGSWQQGNSLLLVRWCVWCLGYFHHSELMLENQHALASPAVKVQVVCRQYVITVIRGLCKIQSS